MSEVSKALKQTERNLSKIAEAFQKAMRGNVFAGRALRMLQQIPGPPKYPIRWSSERQRKAFFATDGFGRGIPTRRTGNIAAGWEVSSIPDGDGVSIILSNPADETKFVHGPQPFGQGFHIDTGWTQLESVEEMFFAEAEAEAVQIFYNEIDPLGGV